METTIRSIDPDTGIGYNIVKEYNVKIFSINSMTNFERFVKKFVWKENQSSFEKNETYVLKIIELKLKNVFDFTYVILWIYFYNFWQNVL